MSATALKQKAYAALRERILTGDIQAGEFLSERRLAVELGMSKTPVHAALERLEVEGLITVAPQRGAMVRQSTLDEALDSLELRLALERHIVRLLAGRLSGADLAELRRALQRQSECVRNEDMAGYSALDADYHLLLAELTGNREIIRVMAGLRSKVFGAAARVLRLYPPRLEAGFAEHAALVDALEQADEKRALEIMEAHIDWARKVMTAVQGS
jgi:DNA-binding GntR family transcriptional regulator